MSTSNVWVRYVLLSSPLSSFTNITIKKVAMVNKEWGKEEITELREKLEQFKPSFVLGVREDIFSIKKNIDLEGSAFPTPEKLKVLILSYSFFSTPSPHLFPSSTLFYLYQLSDIPTRRQYLNFHQLGL